MKIIVVTLLVSLWAQADVPVIAVAGSASRAVEPNMITLQVEVWAKASQAKVAQESAAKEYQRVKAVLEKFKIKKDDMETTSYNLNPEMDYNYKGGAKPVGFRAAQGLQITHRKVEEAGALLDALSSTAKVETGGVNVQSIAWDYDKRSQVEFELIKSAVEDAKNQADEIAKSAKVKIKGLHTMTNAVQGAVFPQARKAMMAAAEMASVSTELAAGPVKIKVQVQAEYQIQ